MGESNSHTRRTLRERWNPWLSRGVPEDAPPDLTLRIRLTNAVVFVLTGIAVTYTPIYFAVNLDPMAWVTAVMGMAWATSAWLVGRGRHRIGRHMAIWTGLLGCSLYAVLLGREANYQLLLFNGVVLPPMLFTAREGRARWGFTGVSLLLWAVVESGWLAGYAMPGLPAFAPRLLHLNAGLISLGFLVYACNRLSRENLEVEDRLQSANTELRAENDQRLAREAELRAATEAAEAASEAKSDFLANLSHEIRTPMNAVIGLADLCLRSELGAEIRDYFSRIRGSSRALLQLLDDILDFSRIEARMIELQHADFRLSDVLDQVTDLVGDAASGKGLDFIVDASPDVPQAFKGDPLRLSQILANLAGNAVKFTDEGDVVLSVQRTGESGGLNRVRFSVTDTGIGIPAAAQETLFDSFTQAHRSTSRRYGGSGLGLNISQSLLGLMGGTIEVTSEVDRGSTFFFDVLLEEAHLEEVDGLTAPPGLEDAKILVVDRRPETRDRIARMLTSMGFEPSAVASAADASPDAAFDVALVDLGSLDDVQLPGVPTIVVITARERDRGAELMEASCAAGVLIKPVRSSATLDAIMDVLGVRGGWRRSVRPPIDRTLASPIRGARVLVAEDNEANQMVARGILEHAGMEVEIAPNGRDAVEAVKRAPFDAVLMDVHMPEMDGHQATRTIREIPGFADLPIIAMTADAMKGTRERCLQFGMDDHVAKPVDVEVLLSTLVRWVEPSSRARARARMKRAPVPSPTVDTLSALPLLEARPPSPPPAKRPTWERLLTYDIAEGTPFAVYRRLRLVNGLMLLAFVLVTLHGVCCLALGLQAFGIASLVIVALIPLTHFVFGRRAHGVGRLPPVPQRTAATLALALAITVTSLLADPRADFHVLLLLTAIVPLTIFRSDEGRWMWTTVAVVSGLWLVAEIRPVGMTALDLPDAAVRFLHADAAVLCLVFLAVVIQLLSKEYGEATELLRSANRHMEDEIEQRRLVEVALRVSKDAAERANRAKSDFLANMSHEIRTPLNAIRGLSELCIRAELPSPQEDYARQLHASARSLLGTINDILDFSRLEAGKLELDATDVGLDDLLAGVRRRVQHDADEKGLVVTAVTAGDVPEVVVGDPMRLRQVLDQLAGNAVKFTHDGEVKLKVTRISAPDAPSVLRFAVTDTGIGIAEETQERLFDSFTQVDASTTRTYEGTGLGLAIAGRLVGLMGGTIQIDSALGRGSAFTFDLALEAGSSEPRAARPASWPRGGLRVLVVDDEETNRLVAQRLLEGAGASVETAADGEGALDALRRSAFDAVLMDLHMPGIGGLEAARRIRSNPDHAGVRIFATTGDSGDETRQSVHDAGMDARIDKPLDVKELLDTLSRSCEVRPWDGSSPTPAVADGGIDVDTTLERLHGDQRVLQEVLTSFHRRFGSFDAELEGLLESGYLDGAARRVHALKGVAGNVGATRLYQRCVGLEVALRQEDSSGLDALAEDLSAALHQALESCEPHLTPSPATGDPGAAPDIEAVRPRLEELAQLVARRNLKAPRVLWDILDTVGRGRHADLDQLEAQMLELDFLGAEDSLARVLDG